MAHFIPTSAEVDKMAQTATKRDEKYEAWLKATDEAILAQTDQTIGLLDLPDIVDIWDMYDNQVTPAQAARIMMNAADSTDW